MADGSTRNDFATASGRLFLKVEDWTDQNLVVVTDLRDKHDFFDKLDRERKELTSNNSPQVRQASVGYPNKEGTLFGSGGRFPIMEAGNVFVDGGELGAHLTSSLDLAAFGGLNARLPEQSYTSLNPDSNVYGGYLDYRPFLFSNDNYFYATNAFVQQGYLGQTERQFWYSNFFFQFARRTKIYYLMYLDFFPRTFLQAGTLNINHVFDPLLELDLLGTSMDSIEYRRLQGVRESLLPSQYQEGRLQLRHRFSSDTRLIESYTYGKRVFDQKTKEEIFAGISLPRAFSRFVDFNLSGGYRHAFDRYGPFGRTGLGYYRNDWELSLEVEQATEYLSDGTREDPLTVELSSGQILSKNIFVAESLQWIKDQKVEIISAFFKLSYRFGNEEITPIRDGAPPAGRL